MRKHISKRMNLVSFFAIVGLLVITKRGTGAKVNLTKLAEEYVLDATKNSKVESWNMTSHYEYWNTTHKRKNKHPITASVSEITYHGDCSYGRDFQSKICNDFFQWYIYSSIVSPFSLLVNLTVETLSLGNLTFFVDLNDATWLTWTSDHVHMDPDNEPTVTTEKKCNFTATVNYTGWFAYKLTRTNNTKNKLFHPVAIGRLQNKSLGLTKKNNKNLIYQFGGIFVHKLLCLPEKHSNRSSGWTKEISESENSQL
uniref:DA-P36 family member n=1 Tax=Rhipicephalus appendiculatus TaxID=34631 RepID=A0A131YRI3_RHIAP